MADQALAVPDKPAVRSAIRRHANCHGPFGIGDCKDEECQAAAQALALGSYAEETHG